MTGKIRIIAGQWRGRRLPVMELDGLRPTTDRIRETLFNWLMNDIRGQRCLDAFAGSGALGWEALSRGAAQVVFLEQHSEIVAQLQQQCTLLDTQANCQIIQADSCHWLQQPPSRLFDVVFLDPPYT